MTFDSHCHLTAEAFDADRDEVLERARAAGVVGMVCVASTPTDADAARALARDHADVWATAGVHPHEAGKAAGGRVDEVAARLDDPRVVAVGECGLEFHYDVAPRAVQLAVLEAQVELAARHDLPLVIHSRDADEDMIAVLRGLPEGVRGVLHCFTGGDALLDAALDADWYVSFSGIATFKRFAEGHQVRRVPEHRILVETDSPYLAPVPYRGKRNEPAHVVHTTRALAEMRGEAPGTFGERVARNARALYRLGGETP
ncbi:MAG TPA: TatD family hydrolase [Longimicrobiales bacterium]|nr:TatD family hydrolase [Longimicrobiales bacterium]